MGKGSMRRPAQISVEEEARRWNSIFRREKRNSEKTKHDGVRRGDRRKSGV